MTPEAQRIAIAAACNWKRLTYKEAQAFDNTIIEFAGWDDPKTSLVWLSPDLKVFSYDTFRLPDYLNDLNAMHEALQSLTDEQLVDVAESLGVDFSEHPTKIMRRIVRSELSELAKAYLLTISTGEEGAA